MTDMNERPRCVAERLAGRRTWGRLERAARACMPVGGSRCCLFWIAGELLVALVGLLVVSYFFAVRTDPLERLAMGVLAATCLGAGLFSWWNWRGAVRASSETTWSIWS